MKKQIDIVGESMTDEELVQSMAESLKYYSDLVIYGQSIVNVHSPFGRIMEAQEADAAQSVSPAETTERQGVDEGAAIQEYNSWRDNKEAYLNKEHPEWMEKQYGKMCQQCGFRHCPRPECPGEA